MLNRLLVTLCLMLSLSATAKELESITLYIGYVAGSNSDKIARALQKELQKDIPNPIRVEYKPGAGGDVAVGFIANNKKNETNILLTNINLPWWNINKNPAYDYNDLIPVAYLGITPMIFVSSPNLAIKTKADWDRLDPAAPVSFGSSGIGAGTHLGGEVLFYASGKKMLHVPYKGSAVLLPDLIEGRIKTAYHFRLELQDLIATGKVVPFAVASTQRIKSLPDVPTLDELGMKNHWIPVWQILVASPGSDPELIRAVQNSLQKLYNDPARRDSFSDVSDLQLDPKNVILKRSFVQDQVNLYKDYARKIPTFQPNKM